MCRHWGKKILLSFLAVLLYLIIGALAPFLTYPKITEETKKELNTGALFQNTTGDAGPDRAMLLESNVSAWEERLRLMNMAQERIILSTFDMRDGESTRDILALMLKKADEGVEVKILVDGFSGFIRMEPNDLFYAVSSHPNIEIKLYNPINLLKPWTTQGRMHDKYVIVDDLAYILGGRNSFDYFIGDYESAGKSLDREVLVYCENAEKQNSSLKELEDYFNHVWNLPVCRLFHDDVKLEADKKVKKEREELRERLAGLMEREPDLFKPYDYTEVTYETEEIHLLSNPTGIYGKEPTVFYQSIQLMRQADSVVIQTPYAVFNDYMEDSIKELVDQGIEVTLLINSVENGDNFVASSDYLRNKDKIVDTGVRLYEYDGGISNHGKSVVLGEDLSLIGSYNFDLRSTYMDTELMLAIKSRDLASELKGYMMEMKEDSRYVLSLTEYQVPEHIEVKAVPPVKMGLMKLVGLLLQPFRILI